MIIPARLYWAHKGAEWLRGLPHSSQPVPIEGEPVGVRHMVHDQDGVLPNPPGMTLIELELEFLPIDVSAFQEFLEPDRPKSVPCYADETTHKKVRDLLLIIHYAHEIGEEEFKRFCHDYPALIEKLKKSVSV